MSSTIMTWTAAQKLTVSNLRIVVKIAMRYYNAYLNILDLIQEGNVGLLHAVKKYNPYKGTKFSTYASFWIRAYILKFLMDSWSLVKDRHHSEPRESSFTD